MYGAYFADRMSLAGSLNYQVSEGAAFYQQNAGNGCWVSFFNYTLLKKEDSLSQVWWEKLKPEGEPSIWEVNKGLGTWFDCLTMHLEYVYPVINYRCIIMTVAKANVVRAIVPVPSSRSCAPYSPSLYRRASTAVHLAVMGPVSEYYDCPTLLLSGGIVEFPSVHKKLCADFKVAVVYALMIRDASLQHLSTHTNSSCKVTFSSIVDSVVSQQPRHDYLAEVERAIPSTRINWQKIKLPGKPFNIKLPGGVITCPRLVFKNSTCNVYEHHIKYFLDGDSNKYRPNTSSIESLVICKQVAMASKEDPPSFGVPQ
ncbi:hypothetical protein [Beihai shrimp virus 3]|uniref:hypothetical protein n=1 Tax=Beihai shrimp virus 3 TaxID=1922669 RepID=UPI00090AC658|nr:hypothetical protein [Beihai shrimp virus 3]APG79223.1 hypothetical protein [Beihai shrimp virus 3]APG79242.1 hypothetical protein [Beihai shrimp virus 3]